MLKKLSIKNYLLIDDLSVSFNNGFTVITGETGAGKSILVGGISLILGKRADLSVNRDKSKKCIIEGVFDIGSFNLKSIFDENELDYDTDTILRREISSSGKSRAFINDSPVNLSQLSHIGSKIIDIHSQHQNIEVLNSEFQFELLDLISNNKDNILKYKNLYEDFRVKSKALNELIDKKQNLIQTIDYNKFILDEIDNANILDEDLDELENQRDFTYVDDIVEGILKIIEADKKEKYNVYNIGNNNTVELMDFIKLIEQRLGKNAEKNMLPIQPGDVSKTWANVDKLIKDYNYSPSTSIEKGINNFIDWYLNYYRIGK